MAKREDFKVEAGRTDYVVAVRDPETGEQGHRIVYAYAVSFRTRFGHEYTHRHCFPDTPAGLRAAERLARRVASKLATDDLASLDMAHWEVRTLYGSDAYLDEESDIVARERSDDEQFMG